MFSGLVFMVNGKMCINVSDEDLMRFNPKLKEEIAEKPGFLPMIMKGRHLNGYCYITPEGFQRKEDFEYYINICLEYKKIAKSSKKRKNR